MRKCKVCGEEIDNDQYFGYNQMCPECNRNKDQKGNKSLIIGLIGLLLIPIILLVFYPPTYTGVYEGVDAVYKAELNNETLREYIQDGGDEDQFIKYGTDEIEVEIRDIKEQEEIKIYDSVRNETLNNLRAIPINYMYKEYEVISSNERNIQANQNITTYIISYNKEVYSTLLVYGSYFIATNVNYEDCAQEIEKFYKDTENIDVSINVRLDGLDIEFSEYDAIKKIEIQSSYTTAGILSHYLFRYNDETLMEISLQYDTTLYKIIGVSIILIPIGLCSFLCIISNRRRINTSKEEEK